MDDRKTPFDFGTIRVRHTCPKHGEQIGGILIKVDASDDNPAVSRGYCGYCIIEALDQIITPFYKGKE